MSGELKWLTLTVILARISVGSSHSRSHHGARAGRARWRTLSRTDKPQSPWAQRLYFAHTNAVENLTDLRAAGADPRAVRTIRRRARSSPARSDFWARLAHAVVYTMGVPVLRTLAFAVGFAAQVALALAAFGKL